MYVKLDWNYPYLMDPIMSISLPCSVNEGVSASPERNERLEWYETMTIAWKNFQTKWNKIVTQLIVSLNIWWVVTYSLCNVTLYIFLYYHQITREWNWFIYFFLYTLKNGWKSVEKPRWGKFVLRVYEFQFDKVMHGPVHLLINW
jgi:hypothetical protein